VDVWPDSKSPFSRLVCTPQIRLKLGWVSCFFVNNFTAL
jgi:hypothetical protein